MLRFVARITAPNKVDMLHTERVNVITLVRKLGIIFQLIPVVRQFCSCVFSVELAEITFIVLLTPHTCRQLSPVFLLIEFIFTSEPDKLFYLLNTKQADPRSSCRS